MFDELCGCYLSCKLGTVLFVRAYWTEVKFTFTSRPTTEASLLHSVIFFICSTSVIQWGCLKWPKWPYFYTCIWEFWSIKKEGSLLCHTGCYTGPCFFLVVLSKGPPHLVFSYDKKSGAEKHLTQMPMDSTEW